jgi:hypothetical protein
VELAKWDPTLHGPPWRAIKGVKPDALKGASPVLNGGDEETGLSRPRLVATQLESGYVQRLLLRFECIQQWHYGMKLLAYTLINLRAFCGV